MTSRRQCFIFPFSVSAFPSTSLHVRILFLYTKNEKRSLPHEKGIMKLFKHTLWSFRNLCNAKWYFLRGFTRPQSQVLKARKMKKKHLWHSQSNALNLFPSLKAVFRGTTEWNQEIFSWFCTIKISEYELIKNSSSQILPSICSWISFAEFSADSLFSVKKWT